jgi:hypothetical protein
MPKATLFEAGTIGVDLKTNPLFLGKKKLHAATNLVFEEGVLKTRPGFRYLPLGCTGIFQGACEFHPKRGLSTASFSELEGGVVVAVGGKLYFNCGLVKGVEFPCHGNVNLFQAENYLIIQHTESETYWWDGVNPPVKSPGMNEQDFNDPEMPFVELETVAPVGDVPACAPTLFIGLSITLQYIQDDDVCGAGHACNSAIYNIFGNDILIGKANLNNENDGGSRIATFVLTEDQARSIAAASVDNETIAFRFECDTEDPLFDTEAWGGNCHPEVGQLVIHDSNGTELYNGCPAGSTIDIDINPAP